MVFAERPPATPGVPPRVDAVTFSGTGIWNGRAATYEAAAADNGEPGAGHDTVTITIRVGANVVSTTTGTLSGGNILSMPLHGR
jgi:hypothetical protein